MLGVGFDLDSLWRLPYLALAVMEQEQGKPPLAYVGTKRGLAIQSCMHANLQNHARRSQGPTLRAAVAAVDNNSIGLLLHPAYPAARSCEPPTHYKSIHTHYSRDNTHGRAIISLSTLLLIRLILLYKCYRYATMASIPKTMSGILIEEPGDAEVLKWKTDLAVPQLSEGKILVKNEWVGVNYIDT